MTGSAIIAPISFGDKTLPKLDLRPVPEIKDTLHDWSTERLNPGPVEFWYDTVNSIPFMAPNPPSQKPVVYDDGRKYLRFNGADQRMNAILTHKGPRTLILVGRFTKAEAGQYLMTTGTSGGHNLYTGGNGKFAFYGTAALSSKTDMDTNFHLFIVSINGDRSTISIDGIESAGDPGTINEINLALGSGSGKYYAVDVQRIAILPYAADMDQRNQITATLRSAYNI